MSANQKQEEGEEGALRIEAVAGRGKARIGVRVQGEARGVARWMECGV